MPFYSELVTVFEAAKPDNHNLGKTSKVSIIFSPKIYWHDHNAQKFLNLNQSIPKSKKQQKTTKVIKISMNITALYGSKFQRN